MNIDTICTWLLSCQILREILVIITCTLPMLPFFFGGGEHFPLRFLLLSALINISYICSHMLSMVLQCLFEELVYFLSFKQLEV